MQPKPTTPQIVDALTAAADAVLFAHSVRKRFGRRLVPFREQKIDEALARCAVAAAPLRSYIGMVAWHDLPLETELAMKKVMQELRYERRQLTKMKT